MSLVLLTMLCGGPSELRSRPSVEIRAEEEGEEKEEEEEEDEEDEEGAETVEEGAETEEERAKEGAEATVEEEAETEEEGAEEGAVEEEAETEEEATAEEGVVEEEAETEEEGAEEGAVEEEAETEEEATAEEGSEEGEDAEEEEDLSGRGTGHVVGGRVEIPFGISAGDHLNACYLQSVAQVLMRMPDIFKRGARPGEDCTDQVWEFLKAIDPSTLEGKLTKSGTDDYYSTALDSEMLAILMLNLNLVSGERSDPGEAILKIIQDSCVKNDIVGSRVTHVVSSVLIDGVESVLVRVTVDDDGRQTTAPYSKIEVDRIIHYAPTVFLGPHTRVIEGWVQRGEELKYVDQTDALRKRIGDITFSFHEERLIRTDGVAYIDASGGTVQLGTDVLHNCVVVEGVRNEQYLLFEIQFVLLPNTAAKVSLDGEADYAGYRIVCAVIHDRNLETGAHYTVACRHGDRWRKADGAAVFGDFNSLHDLLEAGGASPSLVLLEKYDAIV
jgi:hypothetical protein